MRYGAAKLSYRNSRSHLSTYPSSMRNVRREENYSGRPDWFTRALVEAAIKLSKRVCIKNAAEFLAAHDVAFEIAVRVLARQPSRTSRHR